MATAPGSIRSAGVKADSDVYTALMLVSFLFTFTATIYVAYRCVSLFGSLWPPAGS